MKSLIKNLLPNGAYELLLKIMQMRDWRARGYLDNSPQVVKQSVFQKYGVPKAQWVETGTYLGTTTNFLANRYSFVYSIEPGPDLYKNALGRFSGRNVELFNGVSEEIFPNLLPKLEGDINFWLDGHYSGGITFEGDKHCPVEDELASIHDNLDGFSKVAILIDDVRSFLPSSTNSNGYPSIDYLVDWARTHGFNWHIQHDIFIMRNF